jgi:hypothetical protein
MIHELRIYSAESGKMPALLARFRDLTMELFEKHGITKVGYWLNSIAGRSDELWYIVGFENLAAREQAWASFVARPRRPAARRPPAWRPRGGVVGQRRRPEMVTILPVLNESLTEEILSQLGYVLDEIEALGDEGLEFGTRRTTTEGGASCPSA